MTDMKNANFPVDADNRTYHLYLKRGEVAPRVITVGDLSRALLFAKLPGFKIMFVRQAPRLFTTITGTYKDVPVTIIVSLMGIPNMDFTVRELRYVIEGPMSMIRIGSCGSPAPFTKVGDLVVPKFHHTVLRLPDAYLSTDVSEKFHISKAMQGDDKLHELLMAECKKTGKKVYDGHNISACSFYSSQGRTDANFQDHNEALIDYLVGQIPDLVGIEMESAHLIDLARIATVPIYAAAGQLVLAQRKSQAFLSNDEKHAVEREIGIAALETAIAFVIPGMVEQPGAVWKEFKGEILGDAKAIQ
eukprot:EST47674.1 Phosphorylase superfamily protein [Spironucleus salmonicida]